MTLVRGLLDLIYPPRPTERVVRALDGAPSAAPKLIDRDAHITALLPYQDPVVAACIIEAKYHSSVQAQALLRTVLADYLTEWLTECAAFGSERVLLVPVPLGGKRRRERGYNQAEVIATGVDGVELAPHVLVRTRETLPQTTLGRTARLKNMEGAFEASGIDPACTYIVFDDVVTTGATLQAAARALREAGAAEVHLLALAHQA